MSNTAWISSAAALEQQPSFAAAVEAGRTLTGMWPLHDHMHIDNDVKYAESFQVRITRQFALALTGEDVTVPDAEYVYEGADEIPGRPQNIVDALLAANDAYDESADFSDDGDATHLIEAAHLLGDVWNDATEEAVRALTEQVAESAGQLASDDLEDRYALTAAAFADVLATVSEHASDEAAAVKAALPVVLYFKELNERFGVPIIGIAADELEQFRAIAVAGPDAQDDGKSGAERFGELLNPLAEAEWKKRHDDILWDPVEAKKKAREEDEAKSKAALAAKFAHIKDDPSKEKVEL
ncbi:hypothetical protein [Bifidobacterium simiarum]|uniref:Uncharacterized protein n=1 Tax=Bifidobacterium simiarum TaxID=2045441 RepID=A0A2M9HF12_9BIFI|nr:hypothetical protein [Bifidobacterium simiarum]PJM75407.1 hypothetical protein CSQ87_05200 [Bifidobacterium simiarum]